MKTGDFVVDIGEYVEEVHLAPGTVGVIADYNEQDTIVDWAGNPVARVCCIGPADLRTISHDEYRRLTRHLRGKRR